MESADDIQFIINNSCDSHIPVPAVLQSESHDENMTLVREEVKSLLAKITGSDVAERVLADSLKLIVEEEVEVRELVLTEDERVLLYSCFNYFTPVAWLAVGQNMQHSNSAENLLLPVYTTADERFWLFRSKNKPSRIAKCVFSTKISGQWLDVEDDGIYSFLHDDVITGKNLIRSALGPLYFVMNHCEDTKFALPDKYRNAILKTLGDSGL